MNVEKLLYDFVDLFFLHSISYFQDEPILKVIDCSYFSKVANIEN